MRKFVDVIKILLVYVVSFIIPVLCGLATLNETDFWLKLVYGFCTMITALGFAVLCILTSCFYIDLWSKK